MTLKTPEKCLKYSYFLLFCYSIPALILNGWIKKASRAADGPRAVVCTRLLWAPDSKMSYKIHVLVAYLLFLNSRYTNSKNQTIPKRKLSFFCFFFSHLRGKRWTNSFNLFEASPLHLGGEVNAQFQTRQKLSTAPVKYAKCSESCRKWWPNRKALRWKFETKGILNNWQLKERWNWNCAAVVVVLDWAPYTHRCGGVGKSASWLVTAEVLTICSVQQREKWLSAALSPLLLFACLKESQVWRNSKWMKDSLWTQKNM